MFSPFEQQKVCFIKADPKVGTWRYRQLHPIGKLEVKTSILEIDLALLVGSRQRVGVEVPFALAILILYWLSVEVE